MNGDPKQALLITRVIWAALIAGQVMFLALVPVMWSDDPQGDIGTTLLVVSVAMLVTFVPIGYFVRMQVYKANWREDVVAPQGYIVGNLILLTLCESVAFVGLVGAMLSGALFPALIPTILALAVQIINFPNGRAMLPDPLAS